MKIYGFLCAIALLMSGTSCSVDVPSPDLYSDPDAISNVQSARALLTSCYLLYPHNEYEMSVLGNDFCPTSLSGKDIDQQNLYNWQDKSISKLSADMWLAYYNTIANCDVLLERLPSVKVSGDGEEKEKQAVESEVKTLKAMCYFNLLRLFATPYNQNPDGDGVIIKSHVGLEFCSRSSKRYCVEYIRALLSDAAKTENNPKSNGWLSQKAALYLLSELELYACNYQEAADYASKVLKDTSAEDYTGSNYAHLWDNVSCIARIFAFNTGNSFYSSIQYGSEEGDFMAVNPHLLMTDSDVRRSSNEYEMEMAGKKRILLGKYNRTNKENKTIAYINSMRYAGALFILAEAKARLGLDDEARTLINTYLTTVNADIIPENVSGDELVSAIIEQKNKEFAGEGVNWFDMKRTGSQISRLGSWGQSVSSVIKNNDYRWTMPIPSSEYKYNDNVRQNDGWHINVE